MGVVVQKYGGSSVADAEGVKRVAQRIVDAKRAGHEVVVVVSAMGDTTDELLDLAEQVSPMPAAARARHAADRRRAHLDGAAGDGRRQPRPRGAVVHRQPGRRHHRRPPRQGQDHRRHARPHRGGARRGRDRDRRRLPGRQPGHQGHHHAGPRRLRHHRGGARRGAARPTSARSTPTSTASSPPTRASSRPRSDATASPTRRCWRWRPAARRSCTCAAWSTPAATASPSTSARRSASSTGTWISDIEEERHHGTSHHRRRRARPQRGQDHRRRGARQGRARRPASSRRWPTPRSTST